MHTIYNLTIAVFLVVIGIVILPFASIAQENTDFAKEAEQVLDKHCSNCHQIGKLEESRKGKPADGFGYILNFERLRREKMIVPGLPNASPIFIKMQNGEMPKGTDFVECQLEEDEEERRRQKLYCGPSVEELAKVKNWIESLPEKSLVATKRKFITDDEILAAMSRDLSAISEFIRPQIRYFTLTNLYNAGDPDKDLADYRQAITKLLNSLSFEADVVKPIAIDEQKTVLRVNINALGWTTDKWNALIKLNPYSVFYDSPDFKTLQRETKTIQPFIRGDWFAFSASQPPLYYDLLGLPKTKHELEKQLGINVIDNINKLKVARAGFQKSGVSRNNRLIERHSSRTGAYWESYDFAGNEGRQSFFKFPLGPMGALGNLSKKHGFVHDGGEVIFELPNGFHGYYLTDEKGNRLDKGPTNIVAHTLRRDYAVTNGISCMGCHDKGIKFNDNRPRKQQDQVRDYVLSTAALSPKTDEIIEAVFPTHEVFYNLMKMDQERYAASLKSAGVDLNVNSAGIEKVNGLFKRFEDNLSMELAAAEFGLTREQFEQLSNRHGGEVFELKQRLLSDLVPRDQFVKDYAKIVNKITKNKAIDFTAIAGNAKGKTKLVTSRPPAISKSFDLAFFPLGNEFVKGREVSFKLKSTQPCYLTLVNIDEKNRMAVLFPNKHHQDNRIDAHVSYKIPGKKLSGFKLRFGSVGKEKVIAICNASRPDPAGISHDFSRDVFTQTNFDDSFLTRSMADKVRTRLITVEKDNSKKTGREKQMPPLLANPIDPDVDIEARKAVLLKVKAH